MKKAQAMGLVIFILIIIAIGVMVYLTSTNYFLKNQNTTNSTIQNITIPKYNVTLASWDLDVFGKTKLQSNSLMSYYAEKISAYDLIIIQDIYDESAFDSLCSRVSGYKCETSAKLGRTNPKTQIGIIYKDWIHLAQFTSFDPDDKNRWDKPPQKLKFEVGNLTLIIYTIQTNPEDATYELQMLQYIVANEGNELIIGNLNADCGFYSRGLEPTFSDWKWLITSDTTVTPDSCVLDQIIISSNLEKNLRGSGVMSDVISEQSDHYLVWAKFEG